MNNLEHEFEQKVLDDRIKELEKVLVQLTFTGEGIINLFLTLKEAVVELPLNDSAYQTMMEFVLNLEEAILKMDPKLEQYLNRLTVLNEGEDYEYRAPHRKVRKSGYRFIRSRQKRQYKNAFVKSKISRSNRDAN